MGQSVAGFHPAASKVGATQRKLDAALLKAGFSRDQSGQTAGLMVNWSGLIFYPMTTRAYFAVLVVLSATAGLYGDTITLLPTADTTLFETYPNNNLGSSLTLVAGTTARGPRARALIQFNLETNLPAGAVITSVSLQLQVTKESTLGAKNSNFELRRLLVPWGEGNKSPSGGAPASPGEATWNARFAPDVLWGQPGAAETNDYSSTVSAVVAVDQPGSYQFTSTTNLVADAQLWLDHPDVSFGWLLRSQSEDVEQTARRWASREDPVLGPKLAVEYSPPSAPFRITSIVVGTSNAVIRWTEGTPPYQLQSKISLTETNWNTISILQTNNATFPIATSQAFFRVAQGGLASPQVGLNSIARPLLR